MANLSTLERDRALDALERQTFDVAVIGGGISGAGIAREATLRGLSVAVLEARDFASGTSSKSSKLIHGGLRYLAMGDVPLVRETSRERKVIHRLAPHLAEPRWMVVPTRSRAGLMKLQVGITAYEKLGAVARADQHQSWRQADLAREEPLLDRDVYGFACAYREYLTDDVRLVLANLRSAVESGAVALNHAPVRGIPLEDGRASGVEATCELSGRTVRVRARAVINAAGPWVEAVRRLEDAQAPPLLHLSKGVHVVLRADRLPVRNMVILGASDGRSVFAIRRGPVVVVGTTDTTYEAGEAHWPEISSADVEYLLEPLPRYFDVEPAKPEEVVAAWAGLRPLIAQPGKAPNEISRRDEVLVGPGGVVTVAGGKLTGYRPMSRRTLESAAEHAGIELAPPPEDDPPLAGGDFDGDLDRLAGEVERASSVSEAAAARLVRLYGTEAAAVAGRGSDPIVPGAEPVFGEVDWAIEREAAATLLDFVYRRTRAAYYDPDAREAMLEPASAHMAERLGWDEEHRVAEIERVRSKLASDLAFARARA